MQTSDVDLGYLAHPDDGTHPGVVMVHDVWGLSDHTRDLARRLADEDFAVLAVDLYRDLGEVKIEDPGRFMRSLSDPDALETIQAGADLLASHPATAGRPVGVTGFCMGGTYALLAACACRGLAASAPFYGLLSHSHGILHAESGLDPALKPKAPLDYVPDLRCPLLAFFGDQDQFVPMSDIEALRDGLGKTGHATEIVVYPGAAHAFMNDTRPEAYRPEDARDAWGRLVAFLRQHLAR